MDEDNPELLIHELFTQKLLQPEPAGQTDIGHEGDSQRIDTAHSAGFFTRKRFMGSNMVISAAGRINSGKVHRDGGKKRFAKLPKRQTDGCDDVAEAHTAAHYTEEEIARARSKFALACPRMKSPTRTAMRRMC